MYYVKDLNNDFEGTAQCLEDIEDLKKVLCLAFGEDSHLSLCITEIGNQGDIIEQYLSYLHQDIPDAAEIFENAITEL